MRTTISQQPSRLRFRQSVRIVWALFAKDVLEALKNKNTITIIFTSLLIVFFYRALPGLSAGGESLSLHVFDAGSSRVVPLLENSRNVKLATYPSEEKMKQALADKDVPELGLVIPQGFDLAFQVGEKPELQGYVLRWVDSKDAAMLQSSAEAEISGLLGGPVQINLEGNRVEMLPESDGLGMQAGLGLVFVIIMIGVTLVPHLMLEEKQNRTLDVLTVSPASTGQIVAGKAFAGILYCFLGGAVALVVNQALVVHWWLALLTVVLGSLFTVSLGLWLGIKIESRAQLSVWMWVILLPLILPVIFALLQPLFPDVLVRIVKIVPTAAIFDLVRISFADPIPIGTTFLLLAWVSAAAGLGLAVGAWSLRRRDRGPEASSSPWRQSLTTTVAGSHGFFKSLLERVARLRHSQNLPRRQPSLARVGAQQERRPRSSLAMIRTLAAKDLLEALKNRLILSILVGTTIILLSGAFLPLLLFSNNLPQMVVYDQGHSAILNGLSAREDLRMVSVNSPEEMEAALATYPNLRLGLILPADFDQRAGDGQAIQLQAYFPHWAAPDQLSQQTAFFEGQFSQASQAVIHLDLAGHAVYPSVNLAGQSVMLLVNLLAVTLIIGITLVPLLMIEEKEARTLNVLLVSPASLKHVIIGKALVGFFYSLIPVAVIIAFYHRLFVHWDVTILAVFLTSCLAVVAGLLLGIMSDSATTASMWGSLILVIMIGSAFLKLFSGLNVSPAVQFALDWLPGSAILQLFSISQAGEVPSGSLWLNVSALLVAIVAVSILMAWRMRRMERGL
jgi:ABC-2 type transport system permease protein